MRCRHAIKVIALDAQGILGGHVMFSTAQSRPRPLIYVDCSWTAIHAYSCMGSRVVEEALLSPADTEVTTLGLSGPQERQGQSRKQYWKRNTRGSTSSTASTKM